MASNGKPVVLLAEKDEHVNHLLSGILKLQGVLVYSAYSAEDFLGQVERLGKSVDLVCLNGALAAEKGGLMISRMRDASKDARVIVVADGTDDRTGILRYGVDEFVSKPVSSETIAAKVMSLLPARDSQGS